MSQAERNTVSQLTKIMIDARLDDVSGSGRETQCWCSDSNGAVSIAKIFAVFEENYTLTPKMK